MPSEKAVVTRVGRELMKIPGSRARKVHGGQFQQGEPDVDACVQGRAVKIEVKQPGKEHTVTPLQQRMLDLWRAAGAVTGVVTHEDQVHELLAQHGFDWEAMAWRADVEFVDDAETLAAQVAPGRWRLRGWLRWPSPR